MHGKNMISLDWSILWVIVNLIILYLLLKKFLFGPVTAMMDKRQKLIQDNINETQAQKLDAEKLKTEYEETLKNAHQKAIDISNAAKAHTFKECDLMLENAKEEAARIIEEAEKSIESERVKAMENAKYEIADLALLAAAKVINKNLDSEKDKKLAESFLSEVGEFK